MPFITAGYPRLADTQQVIPALERAGAKVVEVGFPFSDPIADGPVIASSMHDALCGGVTPDDVMEIIERVRGDVGIGLIAMVSQSIVARIGIERFLGRAAGAGVDGLIIPDIDLGAAQTLAPVAAAHGLTFSLLVAPTTAPDRLGEIARLCTGFVYLLARIGLTGESDALPEISDRVQALRAHTDLPIAVGFGISTAAQVRAVTESADAAIIGSALVRRMGAETGEEGPAAAAERFVAELAAGLSTRGAKASGK